MTYTTYICERGRVKGRTPIEAAKHYLRRHVGIAQAPYGFAAEDEADDPWGSSYHVVPCRQKTIEEAEKAFWETEALPRIGFDDSRIGQLFTRSVEAFEYNGGIYVLHEIARD